MVPPDRSDASRSDVDSVVDENGVRIPLNEDQAIAQAIGDDESIATTGPTNWWRVGLLALAALVILIGILQLLGGPASTDVVPGTPVSAPPTVETPAPR